MNDWHYVKITLEDEENGVYMWKNKAGAWWNLTQKPDDPSKLTVDQRCPYYSHGYHEATLKFDENGKVIQIAGPFGERYNKQPDEEDGLENVTDITKAYKHKYLGGTLKFDVNVSDVGCNCAAGVFLVTLDEE